MKSFSRNFFREIDFTEILNHFSVEDLDAIIARAKQKGVKIVRDIFEEQDEFGKVRYVFTFISFG